MSQSIILNSLINGNNIGRSGIQLKREEVTEKLLALLPKEGGVLMQTMADEWIEQGIERGIEQGIERGIEQGKLSTLRTTVLRIVRRRFSPTEAVMQQLEQQVTHVQREDDLNQLIDLALEVMVLPDFVHKLQEFVPA